MAKITDAMAKQMKEMYEQGVSFSEIAKKFGVSHPGVKYAITMRDLVRQNKANKKILTYEQDKDLADKVFADRVLGLSVEEILKKYNLNRVRASNLMKIHFGFVDWNQKGLICVYPNIKKWMMVTGTKVKDIAEAAGAYPCQVSVLLNGNMLVTKDWPRKKAWSKTNVIIAKILQMSQLSFDTAFKTDYKFSIKNSLKSKKAGLTSNFCVWPEVATWMIQNNYSVIGIAKASCCSYSTVYSLLSGRVHLSDEIEGNKPSHTSKLFQVICLILSESGLTYNTAFGQHAERIWAMDQPRREREKAKRRVGSKMIEGTSRFTALQTPEIKKLGSEANKMRALGHYKFFELHCCEPKDLSTGNEIVLTSKSFMKLFTRMAHSDENLAYKLVAVDPSGKRIGLLVCGTDGTRILKTSM